MTPQCETVLKHLLSGGSITGVEAEQVHRVRHLPRRIADLREAGIKIDREMRKDATGQRYARYTFGGKA